jgi:hypothetical protein
MSNILIRFPYAQADLFSKGTMGGENLKGKNSFQVSLRLNFQLVQSSQEDKGDFIKFLRSNGVEKSILSLASNFMP